MGKQRRPWVKVAFLGDRSQYLDHSFKPSVVALLCASVTNADEKTGNTKALPLPPHDHAGKTLGDGRVDSVLGVRVGFLEEVALGWGPQASVGMREEKEDVGGAGRPNDGVTWGMGAWGTRHPPASACWCLPRSGPGRGRGG